MKIHHVLDEYRQGDADKRMSLCLYYRELRDEFSSIEQDDPIDPETSRQESLPPRLLSAILHAVKNIFGEFFFSIDIPTGWY